MSNEYKDWVDSKRQSVVNSGGVYGVADKLNQLSLKYYTLGDPRLGELFEAAAFILTNPELVPEEDEED